MNNVYLRRARPEDRERLGALIRDSGAYAGEYAPMVAGHEVTEEYVLSHEVYIAVDGADTLLGLYALIVENADVDLVFVADKAQGLGVGKTLINHMRARAAELGLASVTVTSHPPAERFYLRMGAIRIGTAPAISADIFWERPILRFDIANG